MRIIRAYTGAVPGPPTFAWHAFQTVVATVATTTAGGLTETVVATVEAAAGAGSVTYSGLALAPGAPSTVTLNTVTNQPGVWYGILRPAGALGWIVRTKIGNTVQGDTFVPWGSSAHEHASIEDVTGALVAAYWGTKRRQRRRSWRRQQPT